MEIKHDPKVKIKYIESSLAAQHGSKPKEMGLSLARKYVQEGLAVIVGSYPNLNLNPPVKETPVKEDKNLTKISWITTAYVDNVYHRTAEECGFQIETYTANVFSLQRLIQANLIIIDMPLAAYGQNQLNQIKGILFQRKYPFVLRIVNSIKGFDLQQFLISAKLVIFKSQNLFDKVLDTYNESFDDWFIEGAHPNGYDFWKKLAPVADLYNSGHMTGVPSGKNIILQRDDEDD